MGFRFGFGMFELMFTLMFLVVIGILVFTMIQNIAQWNKNNHSPRLTVPATVASKRADISHRSHRGTGGHRHHYTSTTYFVTFQVDSGDRMELQMNGGEYGLLVEGDRGNLSFQGTRYLGFERL